MILKITTNQHIVTRLRLDGLMINTEQGRKQTSPETKRKKEGEDNVEEDEEKEEGWRRTTTTKRGRRKRKYKTRRSREVGEVVRS